MSLVPFAPAPAAPAGGPAVSTRHGVVPRIPSGNAPTQAAVIRPHGASADTRPGVAARAREPFASVLDSVQQDAASETAAVAGSTPGRQRLADGEGSAASAVGESDGAPPPGPALPATSAPLPSPGSSWLLLALEHGTSPRTDVPEVPTASEASDETATLTGGPAALSTASLADAMTTLVAVHPVNSMAPHCGLEPPVEPIPTIAAESISGAMPSPVAFPGQVDVPRQGAAPAHSVPTRGALPAEATGDVEAANAVMSSSGAAVTVRDATMAPALDAIEPVTIADPASPTVCAPGMRPGDAPEWPAGDPVTGAERLDGASADALRFSRAATALTVEAAEEAGTSWHAPRTPGHPGVMAVNRLAQRLIRLASEEAAPTASPVLRVPIEGESEASVVAPSTRASDVLWRLAQAGGPVPPRSHDGGIAPVVVPLSPSSDLSQGIVPAAASSQAAAMPSPPAVGEQVVSQIVTSLKMQWRDGVGEAKLHLRPEALGQVSLTLRVEQGAVTAVVRAESPQVQEWVLQHQQALRQQLQEAGLRLDELSVDPDGEAANQGQRQDAQDESPERQPRRRASRRESGLHFDQLL